MVRARCRRTQRILYAPSLNRSLKILHSRAEARLILLNRRFLGVDGVYVRGPGSYRFCHWPMTKQEVRFPCNLLIKRSSHSKSGEYKGLAATGILKIRELKTSRKARFPR